MLTAQRTAVLFLALALPPNLIATAAAAAVLACGDDLRIHQLEIGPMKNYQYVIEDGKVGVSVDAAWSIARIVKYCEKLGVKLVGGLYTHGHFDHVGGSMPGQGRPAEGAKELVAQLSASDGKGDSAKVWMGKGDVEMVALQNGLSASAWAQVSDGDIMLPFGAESALQVVVIDSPGHSPGGVSYLLRSNASKRSFSLGPKCTQGVLFTGDTVFLSNVGRTDLPGGDQTALLKTLSRLSSLPDDVIMLSGHSYNAPPRRSTLAEVRTQNSFMQRGIESFPPQMLPSLPRAARIPRKAPKASEEL
mmetsp:Transcript_73057/g.174052  ORF Transcript_73057/g.174052 Transcript_73057/m.174052 type:complete len:304 (-) Transcript_73057:175-1086(-)|eukprot:CAMPEP_0178438424 /NCGR_PEP_ID=MMETSP0689_2-20121128/35585_1 /TAXON_ID=160604 /ORGANISM="Amphidinium massartii, Strain CS-259" /LENGTH=303 /DNA_ID=CAMNT_0020060825 /DNA_START=1 /DNA_END=912 /DNA_ORIENTATION=-